MFLLAADVCDWSLFFTIQTIFSTHFYSDRLFMERSPLLWPSLSVSFLAHIIFCASLSLRLNTMFQKNLKILPFRGLVQKYVIIIFIGNYPTSV